MDLLEYFLLLAPDEDEPEDEEPIVVQPQDAPIKSNKKLDPPPRLP